MFSVVLVALALDIRDHDVLDAVVALAPAMGLQRIHLVFVHPSDPFADPVMGNLPIDTHTEAAPEGLQGYARQLRQRLPGVDVTLRQLVGRPHERITQEALEMDADLVAISRLAVQGDRPAWGSRGLLIARHVSRSVLVVPQGSRVDLSRVVVGMDFSARAVHALKVAASFAEGVRALYAFHCDPGLSYGGISPREFSQRVTANAGKHFREEVLPDLPPGSRVPELDVAEVRRVSDALIEFAGEAGLLVVGSRGLTPLASMLLGSTAERVGGLARAPVLIVRNKGEDLGLVQGLLQRVGGKRSP